jgi:hypothetical protein
MGPLTPGSPGSSHSLAWTGIHGDYTNFFIITHRRLINQCLIWKWIFWHLAIFNFKNYFNYSQFVWRDSFIFVGYYLYQKFNLTTQLWTQISTSPPVPLYQPGCIVLPNEEILVVGSFFSPTMSLIYNHVTNTWRTVSNTNANQGNTNKCSMHYAIRKIRNKRN